MRVLVLAPTGRDASNTQALLQRAGIEAKPCRNFTELAEQIGHGAGAVLLTEESLADSQARTMSEILAAQPHWSDLPFIVLTRGGPDSPAALRAMQTLGNVVLLERPVRASTCVIATRSALRARSRQYQTRGYLAQLQEADHRKNEFLAMLAHELRNPLAPIRNSVAVMQMGAPADRRTQSMLSVVERQVQHLSRLVDDLLDISRITRGKVEIHHERVLLADVVASAVETSRPLMERFGHQFLPEVAEQPIVIEGDLTRLAQVISNLLNNAAKYTPEGGRIGLSAGMEGAQAVIRVRDNGVGIEPAMLDKVFDLFTQVDTSLARAAGGLGIGLTLVRSIVELHGGSVRAASAGAGCGAEFIVSLPATAQANAAALATKRAAAADAAHTPRRILVVDDNRDAADSLSLLLREAGHEVATAYSGLPALQLAASFRPDVIILDIGLPGMDGYEVAGRMRSVSGIGEPVVLALTGYAQPRDRERAWQSGFDHYLIKPTNLQELHALLAQPPRGTTH